MADDVTPAAPECFTLRPPTAEELATWTALGEQMRRRLCGPDHTDAIIALDHLRRKWASLTPALRAEWAAHFRTSPHEEVRTWAENA